jgi:hypothetical protein
LAGVSITLDLTMEPKSCAEKQAMQDSEPSGSGEFEVEQLDPEAMLGEEQERCLRESVNHLFEL